MVICNTTAEYVTHHLQQIQGVRKNNSFLNWQFQGLNNSHVLQMIN